MWTKVIPVHDNTERLATLRRMLNEARRYGPDKDVRRLERLIRDIREGNRA